MWRPISGLMLGCFLATTGCDRPAKTETGTQTAATAQQIAWREGDVDDAFAEAKETNKPVLLYWGAKWCPPCNLMKSTLFKDPAFIAQTRAFIPVHLDGDAKGAQIWGEKFGIQGYPTVILLRPDHSEITRLSGGSTASTLADILRVAATRTTSTEDLLRQADDPTHLSTDDWRLLASFDWLDDPKHFGDSKRAAAFLAKLAGAAPDPAIKRHLQLTALEMSGGNGDVAQLTPAQQAEVQALLPQILSDYAEVKANRQELTFGGASLIRALPDPATRKALGVQLLASLDKVAADRSVPLGDRFGTIDADIALSKSENGGKVAPAVLAKVRERVAFVDHAATDPMMRQAVMPNAGQALDDAGDPAGATKLLEAELPHAVAPYYYMIDLSGIAEEQKDNTAAISWARKAAEIAEGPATRIQWAVLYANTVMRLTPDDKGAVEQSAAMVIDALGRNSGGYAQRTAKRADDWGKKMREWSARHDGAAVLTRLETRMGQTCPASDATAVCHNVLKAA
ncbi:thioredoxin family protein [Sphingomonas abietis]|uniref:Thioredoxin family protein n=1 Tax=Sphingomonas abietis TaxID=3012344 RepID=A0ABY7NQT5_9SPHN|nr:thioredoxin family protein [Sphingomonas abietis]WBO23748.1 thioredoxin family protein [Sphingomonas abietis]